MLKVSKSRLDQMTRKGAVINKPQAQQPKKPVQRASAPAKSEPPKQDPAIERVVQSAAAAAEASRMTAADLREAVEKLPQPRDPEPRGAVRMVVVRDKKGLIDYIDVVNQETS